MKHKFLLFCIFSGTLLFIFLQKQYSYLFFFNEQSHLFLNGFDYFKEALTTPGGFLNWLSDFLIQFFIIPYAGSSITAIILTITAYFLGRTIQQLSGSVTWAFTAWIPMIAQMWITTYTNSNFAGTLAMLAMSIATWVCLHISSCRFRLLYEGMLGILLVWLAGSIGILFTSWSLLYEVCKLEKKIKWQAIIPFFICICFSFVLAHFLIINEMRFAFLPDAYYHPLLKPQTIIYSPWIILLILTGLSLFIGNKDKMVQSTNLRRAGTIVCFLTIAGWAYWGTLHFGEKKLLLYMKLDYLSRTEQWQEIERICNGKTGNYLYMSMLARALAEQGKLTDNLLKCKFKHEASLIVPWNRTEEVSTLLSDIHFTVGNIAQAQRMAFEGNLCSRGNYNVRLIQRLIQTNLIFGEYNVAEKYIRLLEKTWFYRDWANKQRKYLNNDKLIEQDPLLGHKRELLPAPNDTSMLIIGSEELEPSMMLPILASPSHAHTAFEYLMGSYLIKKELGKFKQMIDRYAGSPLLPKLPTIYQEALIVIHEITPEMLDKYELDQKVLDKYAQFRKEVLSNRNNKNLANILYRTYGQTYWYYMIFS